MARRRKRPLVPAADEALARLKDALQEPHPDPPVHTMVERFRQLARELVDRERLR